MRVAKTRRVAMGLLATGLITAALGVALAGAGRITAGPPGGQGTATAPPNVILTMTDDAGYGDSASTVRPTSGRRTSTASLGTACG